MPRRLYIYWAVPLFTLLGCGVSFVQFMGTGAALALGTALALAAWGLLWMRLYDNKALRPEFAVLGILPQLCFFVLMFSGQVGESGAFAAPLWQNFYFLLVLASMAVQMTSLRPGSKDEARRPLQDPPFIFLAVLIVANGFLSWVQYASKLFPIN